MPSEQLIIYQVGVLPSHFYNVLADKDHSGFKSLVGTAMVLILLNSTVSWRSCGGRQKLTYLLIIVKPNNTKSTKSPTPWRSFLWFCCTWNLNLLTVLLFTRANSAECLPYHFPLCSALLLLRLQTYSTGKCISTFTFRWVFLDSAFYTVFYVTLKQ